MQQICISFVWIIWVTIQESVGLSEKQDLSSQGDYTLELKTSERPYGLKVIYSNTTDKFEIIDFTQYSTELLGLIKNLDYVEITDGKSTHKLTAAEASQALDYDVKEFGTDPTRLEEYLKSIYENYMND